MLIQSVPPGCPIADHLQHFLGGPLVVRHVSRGAPVLARFAWLSVALREVVDEALELRVPLAASVLSPAESALLLVDGGHAVQEPGLPVPAQTLRLAAREWRGGNESGRIVRKVAAREDWSIARGYDWDEVCQRVLRDGWRIARVGILRANCGRVATRVCMTTYCTRML